MNSKGSFNLKFAEDMRIIYRNNSLNQIKPCSPPIRLVWGAGWPNFGDALSPLLVKILSGRQVKGANADNSPSILGHRLIALCSSLWKARDGDIVWGAGLKSMDGFTARKLWVYAVRGPLTRKGLLARNIECPEIYGDPAILMPYLYKARTKNRSGIGIILHFNDLTDCTQFNSSDIKIIDVRDHPLRVIDAINSCEAVLSSSLHGIIIAEAYGVPACWLYPSREVWRNNIPQVAFKYEDYYYSTQRDPVCFKHSGHFDLDKAVKMALNAGKPVLSPEKLLLSFPFLRDGIKSLDDLSRYEIKDVVIEPPSLWGTFLREAQQKGWRSVGKFITGWRKLRTVLPLKLTGREE